MDVLDVVSTLPASSPLRRVVEFCITELKLSPGETTFTLRRAHEVVNGVTTLEHEWLRASGALEQSGLFIELHKKAVADAIDLIKTLSGRG